MDKKRVILALGDKVEEINALFEEMVEDICYIQKLMFLYKKKDPQNKSKNG